MANIAVITIIANVITLALLLLFARESLEMRNPSLITAVKKYKFIYRRRGVRAESDFIANKLQRAHQVNEELTAARRRRMAFN